MSLFFECQKCEICYDKDVLLNFNKKNSRSSLLNKNEKVDISKDEIISIDSTNNLEIIDYPYHINFNANFSSQTNTDKYNIKVPQRNYCLNNMNQIEKIQNSQLDNNTINGNNINNSLNNSSLILNNGESFVQNKALLSNYYENYENFKNKKKKKMKIKIPHKKSKVGKKAVNIFGLKDSIQKNNSYVILTKKDIKSKSQILTIKQNREKEMKTEGEYPKIKKSNTNFFTNISKKEKNIIVLNTESILQRINYRKNKDYLAYNKYSRKQSKKNSKNSIITSKKIYQGKNNIKNNSYKNCKSTNKIIKKDAFLDSSKENKRSFIVKSNLNIYRNTTNYVEKKKNNINFSYLWLNKKEFRDNHYLSKSYVNPFDNIKKNIIKN